LKAFAISFWVDIAAGDERSLLKLDRNCLIQTEEDNVWSSCFSDYVCNWFPRPLYRFIDLYDSHALYVLVR
jgi:hypothetical protein